MEGELDALALAQELRDLAAVVTLGGAADHHRPREEALAALAAAAPWYVASDADDAGDRAADALAALSERCHRVRPPGAFKDWTEALLGGVNLRRWWGDVIERTKGTGPPALFTWDELAAWRWGPAMAPAGGVSRDDRL